MKRASVRILLIAEVPGTGSVPTAGRGRAHAAPVARVNVAAPATTATVAGPGAMGTGAAAGLLAADSMGPGDSTTRGAATTVEVAPTATTHRVPRAARDALIPQASPDPGMRVRQAGAPVLAARMRDAPATAATDLRGPGSATRTDADAIPTSAAIAVTVTSPVGIAAVRRSRVVTKAVVVSRVVTRGAVVSRVVTRGAVVTRVDTRTVVVTRVVAVVTRVATKVAVVTRVVTRTVVVTRVVAVVTRADTRVAEVTRVVSAVDSRAAGARTGTGKGLVPPADARSRAIPVRGHGRATALVRTTVGPAMTIAVADAPIAVLAATAVGQARGKIGVAPRARTEAGRARIVTSAGTMTASRTFRARGWPANLTSPTPPRTWTCGTSRAECGRNCVG